MTKNAEIVNIQAFIKKNPTVVPALPDKPQDDYIYLEEGKIALYRGVGAKGIWQYRITLPPPNSDRYERKSTKTADLEKAKKIASDRYIEIKVSLSKGLSIREATFGEVAERYVQHLKNSINNHPEKKNVGTRLRIKIITEQLIPSIGMLFVSAVRTEHLRIINAKRIKQWEEMETRRLAYVESRRKIPAHKRKNPNPEFKSKSAKPNHTGVYWLFLQAQAVLKYGLDSRMFSQAEMPHLDRIESKTVQRRGSFTQAELQAILSHFRSRAEGRWKETRIVAACCIELMAIAGLRPGKEINLLRFCDVTIENVPAPHTVINVRDGKRGPRRVAATLRAAEIVKELRELLNPSGETELLFRRQTRSMFALIAKTIHELGFDVDDQGLKRTPYSLRHSHITGMLRDGHDPTLVARNCGTSTKMLDAHYDHRKHTDELAKAFQTRSSPV